VRLAERLLSLFVAVRRYRCRAMGCGWEGNLRVSGGAAGGGLEAPGEGGGEGGGKHARA